MTDIIKPFKIISSRKQVNGDYVVCFESEITEIQDESSRITRGINACISVPKGIDLDAAVFQYLQDSGWL